MPSCITSPNGKTAVGNGNAGAVDYSRVPTNAKKITSGKPDSDGLTSVTNFVAAMGPTAVGLARD